MRGVVVVAYGERARREAEGCLRSLGRAEPGLAAAVVSDRPLGEYPHLYAPDLDPGARRAKLACYQLSPFELTCYLDADTRVRGSLEAGFAALAAGWELALCPSTRQGGDVLGNCEASERERTFAALGCQEVLGLQAGVLFFRKCEGAARLFASWGAEWRGGQDQGALLRALYASPARLWLLGRPFNGGSVVEHRFGQAVRRAA